jgi:hyperosmotically inducible protein
MIASKKSASGLLQALLAAAYMAAVPAAHAFGTEDDRVETPLYSEFKKLDRNSDGNLTRKEGARDKDIAATFDKADADKNGSLNAAEYGDYKSGLQQARVESFLDDSSVTAKVKAELLKDDGVKSLAIKVQTHHGQVILSGFVDTEAQAHRAVEIAAGVRGVLAVKNSLVVKG